MSRISQLLSRLLLIGVISMALSSCEDDKLSSDPTNNPVVDPEIAFNKSAIYDKPTYVGNVSEKMREALAIGMPSQTNSIDQSTTLVILGSLNEVAFESLEMAYKNGATIAVENPQKTEFESFFAAHPDWEGFSEYTDFDEKILYSFDNDGSGYYISRHYPIDFDSYSYPEDFDDEDIENEDYSMDSDDQDSSAIEEETVPEYYHYVVSWIDHLHHDDYLDSEEAASEKDPKQQAFKDFADCIDLGDDFTFELDPKFRHYGGNLYWEIKRAKVKVSYTLSINPIHVYDDQQNNGNYLIVTARVTLNNSQAWKENKEKGGPLHQTIRGIRVTYAGFYSKQMSIKFGLVNENGKPVSTLLPANTPILPGNVNNVSTYENENSFSVGASLAVSGGYKKGKPEVGGEAKVSANWEWKNSLKYSLADVSLTQYDLDLAKGELGWRMEFLNTPRFDKKSPGWINLDVNKNCQGSQSFDACWVWKDPSATDESNRKYRVKVYVEGYDEVGSYKIASNWKTKHQTFLYKSAPALSPKPYASKLSDVFEVESRSVGQVELENNLKDTYISNIKVWNTENPKEYLYEDPSTHKPGEVIDLGYYFIKTKSTPKTFNSLSVSFTATLPDGTKKNFKFNRDNETSFKPSKGKKIRLIAFPDFKEM